MNLKTLLALLGICITFISCDKSKDEQPPVEAASSIPKIKTMERWQGSEFKDRQSFEYDSSGRLAKRTSEDGNTETFTYAPGMIISEYYRADLDKISSGTIFLNEKGLFESESGGVVSYEYTAEGYMTKETWAYEQPYGFTFTYAIEDSNTTKRTERNGKDYTNTISRHNYTFLPNSINTIGNENMGIYHLGKQDKNLKSKEEKIILPVYYVFYTNFQYEFDDRNRVVKSTRSRGTAESDYIYTYYTYHD